MPSSDGGPDRSKQARKGVGDGLPKLKPPTQLKFSYFPEENDRQDVRAYLMQFMAADAEDWDDGPAEDDGEALPGINVPKSMQGKKCTKAKGKKGKKGKTAPPADDDSAKFLCPMCGSPFTEDDTNCPNCGKFFD